MVLAGKLNCRTALYRLSPTTLTASLLGWSWASIRAKADDARVEALNPAPAAAGLRSPIRVELRLRARSDLQERDYAVWNGRLFYLYSLRDPDGKGLEIIASAHELIGVSATYTPSGGGTAVSARVFLQQDSPYIAASSQRVDYRPRLELPIFETGRAAPGATVTINGVTYTLLGLVDGGDDGVVRNYWGRL